MVRSGHCNAWRRASASMADLQLLSPGLPARGSPGQTDTADDAGQDRTKPTPALRPPPLNKSTHTHTHTKQQQQQQSTHIWRHMRTHTRTLYIAGGESAASTAALKTLKTENSQLPTRVTWSHSYCLHVSLLCKSFQHVFTR